MEERDVLLKHESHDNKGTSPSDAKFADDELIIEELEPFDLALMQTCGDLV